MKSTVYNLCIIWHHVIRSSSYVRIGRSPYKNDLLQTLYGYLSHHERHHLDHYYCYHHCDNVALYLSHLFVVVVSEVQFVSGSSRFSLPGIDIVGI